MKVLDKEGAARRRKIIKETYPLNLMLMLNDSTILDNTIPVDNITDDMIAGLEYALSTLPPRDQTIIQMRYAEHKPFSQIAKEFDVTTERIRTVEHRAITRLRRPNLLCHIVYGLRGNEIRLQELKEERKKECADKTEQIRIFDMDIGIRAQNRLIASGYTTIEDIISLTEDQIDNIRQLGKQSRVEIARYLKLKGLAETVWSNYLPKGE